MQGSRVRFSEGPLFKHSLLGAILRDIQLVPTAGVLDDVRLQTSRHYLVSRDSREATSSERYIQLWQPAAWCLVHPIAGPYSYSKPQTGALIVIKT